MFKALSVVMSLLMVFSLCVFETGCTSSQLDSTIATINQQLPAAVAEAGAIGVLISNSQVGPEFQKFATAASADAKAAQDAAVAYLANKASGTKQALFSAFSAFAQDVNAQFLAANTVENQKSQQAILTKMAAFVAVVNGFQLILAPFFNKQVQAKSDFRTVQPFIPRAEQEQVAQSYGYTLGQLGL